MRQIKICNGRLITPYRILNGGSLLITGKKITAVSERDIEAPDALTIDAVGKYIAPGFIDLHVHGGGGHDFMDASLEAFHSIAKLHARYGTTAMTPTTLSCDRKDLVEVLQI
jgi:N-acetylglucosamine-6-phosphate deacetylase